MLEFSYIAHSCKFLRPGGTSRGVLHSKPSWIIRVHDTESAVSGYGEVSIIPKLNPETEEQIELLLMWLTKHINQPKAYLFEYLIKSPALSFGLESAFLDLENGGRQIYYPSSFTEGKKEIEINGLIWMDSLDKMEQELQYKIDAGFNCIKIKVGAINITEELKLVALARSMSSDLTLRLDANGAFKSEYALDVLKTFAEFDIHSIEQPIAPKQVSEMAKLCLESPIPIALDEELIGISSPLKKLELLKSIQPQYIILKPSLVGGITGAEEWIEHAEALGIGWWATSALESNLGLNIISQWIATKNNSMPQGLGTGQLFTNNFDSPLALEHSKLRFRPDVKMELPSEYDYAR